MPTKLLLADDSVTVQRVIELTFAEEGVEVTSVGDGEQAIAHLGRDRPDIVLADIGMPGRDGYEVAAHIRNSPELAHIPVVLMTGAFEQLDEARAGQVRCDAVLAKPFEPHMVIAIVRQLLNREPGATSAAPEVPEGEADTGPEADTPASGSLDDYLERLDLALSAATGATPPRSSALAQPAPAGPPAPVTPDEAAALALAAPPNLADAFSALLAEELGETPPAVTWGRVVAGGRERAAEAVATAEPLVLTDAVLDDLTRRVAERLGGEAVREHVGRLVVEVAERLVREEIERIKAGA
jgi:CheY-like chemotaxis protein